MPTWNWSGADGGVSQYFTDALNRVMDFTNYKLNLRIASNFTNPSNNDNPADRWLITYRRENPDQIEIWIASTSYKNFPAMRLWPSAMESPESCVVTSTGSYVPSDPEIW